MSDPAPPPNVVTAAGVVTAWLNSQNAPLTAEQIASLSPADRLDYTRAQSNKQKMPDWKDPRAP